MTASPVQALAGLIEVTIADTESLSAEVNLRGRVICGVYMPAAWTAANLTFQVSPTQGGTYVNLHDTAGDELVVTAGTSRYVAIDPVNTLGINFLKVRSGTSGTPAAQGDDRVLKFAAGIPSVAQ